MCRGETPALPNAAASSVKSSDDVRSRSAFRGQTLPPIGPPRVAHRPRPPSRPPRELPFADCTSKRRVRKRRANCVGLGGEGHGGNARAIGVPRRSWLKTSTAERPCCQQVRPTGISTDCARAPAQVRLPPDLAEDWADETDAGADRRRRQMRPARPAVLRLPARAGHDVPPGRYDIMPPVQRESRHCVVAGTPRGRCRGSCGRAPAPEPARPPAFARAGARGRLLRGLLGGAPGRSATFSHFPFPFVSYF